MLDIPKYREYQHWFVLDSNQLISILSQFSLFSDPPEVEAETGMVHASVGWSLNISCIVWSNPPATVSWYRGRTNMELLQTQTQPQQMVSFTDIFRHNYTWSVSMIFIVSKISL